MTNNGHAVRPVSGCYLLCFAHNPVAHARHYMGYADDIGRRVQEHRDGSAGAVLTSALKRQGGTFRVVRVWIGDTEEDEARRKQRKQRPKSPAMRNQHKHGRGGAVAGFCPECRSKLYRAPRVQLEEETLHA